jgi:hypothetical protein
VNPAARLIGAQHVVHVWRKLHAHVDAQRIGARQVRQRGALYDADAHRVTIQACHRIAELIDCANIDEAIVVIDIVIRRAHDLTVAAIGIRKWLEGDLLDVRLGYRDGLTDDQCIGAMTDITR